jgi:hypothetical protein
LRARQRVGHQTHLIRARWRSGASASLTHPEERPVIGEAMHIPLWIKLVYTLFVAILVPI